MDTVADTGATWFCTAVRAAQWSNIEMQTCGTVNGRFAIGLATVAVIVVFAILATWRFVDMRA